MRPAGVRCSAARKSSRTDPHWRDCIPFYEYFHGDNGAGLGASHQTGWTALVASLAQIFGTVDARTMLESGREGARASTSPSIVSDAGAWCRRDRSAMTLEVLADVDSVARHAAEVIAGEARAAVKARGRFTVAISGGRTPWVMLRALSSLDVPWESVHVLQVDERDRPRGSRGSEPDAPAREPARTGSARPKQIHAMPVESADLDEAAARYAQTLVDIAGSPPVLDLVHLGLGADGHTASLVPGDPVLDVTDADVALTGRVPGTAPDDADVSGPQPGATRALAGHRRGQGGDARPPAPRRSSHSRRTGAAGPRGGARGPRGGGGNSRSAGLQACASRA